MKPLPFLLSLAVLLAACSSGVPSATSAPSATPNAVVETAVPTTPVPTLTLPVPTSTAVPTAVPTDLPPTPAPLPIGLDTIDRLQQTATFGENELLRAVAFSPDGAALATAGGNSYDFNVRIWNPVDGSLLRALTGHKGIVWGVAFSPDGTLLASVSSDHTARIWDWRSGAIVRTLEFQADATSVAFSRDGSILAVGGALAYPDAAIWTFSTVDWRPLLTFPEFWSIPAIVFSPDGSRIAGGGTSRNVRIWDASSGKEQAILYHSAQVTSLALSPDGKTLAAGLCGSLAQDNTCTQGAVWFWDLASGESIRKVNILSDRVTHVAYSADGALLIAGAQNGEIGFYNASTFELVRFIYTPGASGVFDLSLDGRIFAQLGVDGKINLWEAAP